MEEIAIHPRIPKPYHHKMINLRKKTGFTNNEIITIALYLLYRKLEKEAQKGSSSFITLTKLQKEHQQYLTSLK